MGGICPLCSRVPLLLGSPTGPRLREVTKPGTECAKEPEQEKCSPVTPVRGVFPDQCAIFSINIKTTLGNGYLGSRIDEERSEMRYLV